MIEIGSEFWNIPLANVENGIFPEDTRWFLSGRIALKYILKEILQRKPIKTIAMPSWCCESMIVPFVENNIRILFYPVILVDGKVYVNVNVDADVLLVMDYFGISTNNNYKDYPGIVIRDLTHTLFSNQHTDADYYFGSIRKWCGIETGGFAWAKRKFETDEKIFKPNLEYVKLRNKAMEDKEAYINKKSNDKSYLKIFAKAENLLDSCIGIEGATNDNIEDSKRIDVDFIRNRRKKNARIIENIIGEKRILTDAKADDCPLFVPIILEKRDEIRSRLVKKNIYCPIHWPISRFHKLSANMKYIYDHEMSLVCDQRYSEKDIERMCEILLKECQC